MLLPEFIYPSNPYIIAICILIAHLLDYIYPYHSGSMLLIHPVHTSYVMARALGKPYSSRARGVATWIATISIHIALYSSILYIAWRISIYLWIAVASYIMKTSFSLKLLLDIVERSRSCMARGDWGCARYWVQQIVRRNVYQIDNEHVVSASIESLAESIVDGYISPLLYTSILGPIGGLVQRVINSMDSALGYRDPEYIDVGWFSAKMDTIINFIPARIAAVLMVILSPLIGGSIRYSLSIWRRYRRATESINAGNPISAIAGALRIRLEKIGSYTIGEPIRELNYVAIDEALRISKYVALTWLLITIATTMLLPMRYLKL